MPILTLTTDWGINDHYVASFKGSILSGCPGLSIVDVSNTIGTFNVIEASHILKNCYHYFPRGTIHFIGVMRYDNIRKRDVAAIRRLVVKCNGHYFISSDSGIFSLVLGNMEKDIVELVDINFLNELEKYSAAICHLALGNPFEELGTKSEKVTELHMLAPTIDSAMIRCTIIHIDSFGNAVTNLTLQQFKEASNGRKYSIRFPDNDHFINTLSRHYSDVDAGEAVALFNQDGFLEIAQNCDSAQKMFGLKLWDTFRIELE